MYCSSCGAKSVADSNFCRQCGHKLERVSPANVSEEAFDRALPEEEQVTALLERAYRRRKEGDVTGAIALCKEVLEIRPDSTTAHGILGQLYEQNGDRDLAVAQYERVLVLNPGSIADRVKLDDLREGPARRSDTGASIPKVMLVDPAGAPTRALLAWGAAAAVLLILCGAALAVALNRTGQDRRQEAQNSVRPSGGMNTPTVGGSDGPKSREISAERSAQSSGSQGDSASQSGQQASALATAPNFGFGTPNIQLSSPPIQYVLPSGYAPRQAVVPQPGPATVQRAAQKNGAMAERSPVESDSGSERVHLAVSDASNGGDGHNPVIRINRHEDGVPGAKSGSNQAPDPGSSIKVRPHVGPVDTTFASSPTSESAGYIAVGNERIAKMDYAGAISAYSKAISGAGDEVAYVRQQMGECYRARNENRNAISCYEAARDAYRKLITDGRQMEQANAGLKLCENGIKICSSE